MICIAVMCLWYAFPLCVYVMCFPLCVYDTYSRYAVMVCVSGMRDRYVFMLWVIRICSLYVPVLRAW